MVVDRDTVRQAIAREQFFDEHRGVLLAIATLLGPLLAPALMALGWEHLVVVNQSYELGRFGLTVLLFVFDCCLAVLAVELMRRHSSTTTVADPRSCKLTFGSFAIALFSLMIIVEWVSKNPAQLGAVLTFSTGGLVFFAATGAIFRLGRGFFSADIIQRRGGSHAPRRGMVMFLSPHCTSKEFEDTFKKEMSSGAGLQLPKLRDLIVRHWKQTELKRLPSVTISDSGSGVVPGTAKVDEQAIDFQEIMEGNLREQTSSYTPAGTDDSGARTSFRGTFETISKAEHLSFFKWQQNFRAIGSQVTRLLDGTRAFTSTAPFLLVTIPSPESHREYPAFEASLRKIWVNSGFSENELKTSELAPVDYDHLPALTEALREAVHLLTKGGLARLALSDITIDTTAGFKTASIAAAAVTFESDLEFSYVSTHAPWDVIVVDMKARFRPSG